MLLLPSGELELASLLWKVGNKRDRIESFTQVQVKVKVNVDLYSALSWLHL